MTHMPNITKLVFHQGNERLEHFTALGVSISVMCQKPLLEYGAKAYEDHKKGLCTYEVEQVTIRFLFLLNMVLSVSL